MSKYIFSHLCSTNLKEYRRLRYHANKDKIQEHRNLRYKEDTHFRAKRQEAGRAYYRTHKEREKLRKAQYYQENRKKILERVHKYHKEHKEQSRLAQRRYRKKNNERLREKLREYGRKLRMKHIQHLGGKCVICGFNNPVALEFHHKNSAEKESAHDAYKIEVDYSKFMLLCANCHRIIHKGGG